MITINLFIGSRYPIDRQKLRQSAQQILEKKGINHAQLDILVVGKRKIQTLNEQKLKHQGPTDVLSFPHHDKGQLQEVPLPAEVPPHLGDIVISFPEAVRMARRFGKRVDDQLCFYLEHGLMHLLGYHHE
ncbi:MAG: rRNA maturation RNase YbeY [Candidatus Pacebacteria bacterium RIFOXYB1_FULL_39_46]|nr:MAG: rRNA maturation RNase YbeY [Candidatus Pacebacteria bacterium RIFOXYA1_FULL_38_18]OGJ37953.1 MAG: rRNA maturation RNase YbeY [Candidatus Pacebacteria bacterium RIFOXYB1_FULL_39_46]OGJ39551.1 MAG: rRNA maturation RNase YbeY [Candidatus Pacebacteria bacterium RIFOXYC1_FULL_39_21]OGJ40132.1 MAG: rRNA maturation RNase YbeY [Candidatus Pacebacteria bacterium RIFOXYD1_FULL_39_27]